jgi:hypothetical protein
MPQNIRSIYFLFWIFLRKRSFKLIVH